MDTQNLQDSYLERLKVNNTAISVYLINGIKLSGVIGNYDAEIIILKDSKNVVEQLIYKHAVSTITPSKISNVV
ncbi:MAG: RNA chaperone Hfq [Burkholderiales bacterium]|nr:RNA chaperone Hfq [Burkholderiales bacterium]